MTNYIALEFRWRRSFGESELAAQKNHVDRFGVWPLAVEMYTMQRDASIQLALG